MTSDYGRGAWKALLNFRDWLDRHSEALAGYAGMAEAPCETERDRFYSVDGKTKLVALKRKPLLTKAQNANVRKILTAILSDFDAFMKYGEDTEIVGCYDTKSGALVTCKILREKDDMT